MAQLSMKDIRKELQDIDICMMTTRSPDGRLESRPMSNNKQVEYDGDSFFFTLDTMSAVKDIHANPDVCLVFEAYRHLRLSHLYICVSGKGQLIQDKAEFRKHWVKDLDKWFEKGVDTPGLTLIKVHAEHIKYWDGFDHGEVHFDAAPQRLAS